MGAWLVAGSALLGLATAFLLRPRLPAPVVVTLLVTAGAGLGAGGMLLRPDPPAAQFVAAVVALAILVPAHVRIVIGPLGR